MTSADTNQSEGGFALKDAFLDFSLEHDGLIRAGSSLAGEGNWLGLSFSPVMALVGQAFRLRPTASFLLWMQTVFLALGAWPVYVIGDEPAELRFRVAVDDADHVSEGLAGTTDTLEDLRRWT